VSEAASHLGINLKWVTPQEGPEELLPQGKVDLWAVLSDTPERRARFYMTKPWADNQYGVVSLESHQDEPVTTVGAIDSRLQMKMARTTWPNAKVVAFKDHTALFEALCRGDLKHVLMSQRWLMGSSMSRSPACQTASFAVTMLTDARINIATGAAPGMERHADAIRHEIDRMAMDGRLDRIVARYPVGLGSTDWMLRLASVERIQQLLWAGIIAAILIALVAGWQLRRVSSARAQADEALKLARTASAAKSDFLSSMSHEIRTPMNGVLGLTDLLLCTPLNKEQRDCGESIRYSAEALLTILNDILDFSKMEAGHLVLTPEPFEVSRLTRESIRGFEALAREKGVMLTYEDAERIPPVMGDSSRIRQVLMNLLANAIKFTDRGSVKVSWHFESAIAGKIKLSASVEDTGIGVPEEKRAMIFESFQQADASTTRRFGGTGLGLAISKRLIEAMGGSIGVESSPAQGSIFWFTITLPLVPETKLRQSEEGAAELPLNLVPSPRILVVEDNAVNRKLAHKTLTRMGCEVELATNGLEALQCVLNQRFDLVLMDCLMPEMDGYVAAAEIRRREGFGIRVPIVAVSANVHDEDRQRCSEAGMDDFVSKPWRREDLRQVLLRWCHPRS